jgi:hypothetical protein
MGAPSRFARGGEDEYFPLYVNWLANQAVTDLPERGMNGGFRARSAHVV